MPVSPKQNHKRNSNPGVSVVKKQKRIHLKLKGEAPVERFFLLDESKTVSEVLAKVSNPQPGFVDEPHDDGGFVNDSLTLQEKNNMADQNKPEQQPKTEPPVQQTPGQKDAQKDAEDSAALLKELKKFIAVMFKSDIDDLQERVESLEKENKSLKEQLEGMGKTVEDKATEINTKLDEKLEKTTQELDEKVQTAQQVEVKVTNNFTTVKQDITKEITDIRNEFGGDLTNVEDNLSDLMGQVMALNETVGGMTLSRPKVDLEGKKKEAAEKIQQGKKPKSEKPQESPKKDEPEVEPLNKQPQQQPKQQPKKQPGATKPNK